MEILKKNLKKLIKTLSSQQRNKLKNRLDDLISVYPFNEYEYIISSLLALDKINWDDYLEIRDEYIARNMYKQGIHGTNWIKILEAEYKQCKDSSLHSIFKSHFYNRLF